MYRPTVLFICFCTLAITASGQEYLEQFFLHLSKFEFERAHQRAGREKDSLLRFEMYQLADILYYSGQTDKKKFKLISGGSDAKPSLSVMRALNEGYVSLFYDQMKGSAFKHFYHAYQLSKDSDNPILIKACLFAILRYHNFEIAQNSDAYLPYLQHFEMLASEDTDHLWSTLYRMVFSSKTMEAFDKKKYSDLSLRLDAFEETLDPKSPLLTYVFYEKAVKCDIEQENDSAILYYHKAIRQAGEYPFLQYHRFFAPLKLMRIEMDRKRLIEARTYLNQARRYTNQADTLRSSYYLHFYQAFLLRAEGKCDSAFNSLWKAYTKEYHLDFRRNTLAINQLTVELETQEKENANLRLREGRIWLMSAVVGLALLLTASYLAYLNQRKVKQVQSMKMEKLLKDQEILTIDSMIAGQERERQKIADDLHDNLGSLLATLKFHLHSLRTKKDRVESEKEQLIEKTDTLIEEAYQKVRAIAHAGNAGVNAQDGLLPAVRNFASKVSILNQLSIEVEEHGMDERLDNVLEIMIFRIVQELVTNVIKHAHATEVVIHLTRYEDVINLMVEDNGIGFDISQVRPGETMGLHSIQRKIESSGGRVAIESILKKGTSIIIDIPLTI